MAKPRKTIRPTYANISIDEDLAARMQIELYSDLEGKVPHGARSKLINQLLRAHFKAIDKAHMQLRKLQAMPGEAEGAADGA